METIRAFIAIELPEKLQAELARLQTKLGLSDQPWVKPVDPSGIHLTIKFLGNIDSNNSGAIVQAMALACREIPPFRLKVAEVGAFPNLGRIQVVWVGLAGELEKLVWLQRGIESNLKPLGFPAEERTFSPHLTLARLRNQASASQRRDLGQLIADTRFEADTTIEVNAIGLIRSHLTGRGAIYHRIGSVALQYINSIEG